MAQQIKADKEHTLITQLLQVADLFDKIRERELLPQNLSATAADVLFLVDAMGQNIIPANISRMILRETHTITALLVRMETNGLIKRAKDKERRSCIRITLTIKGEDALKEAMKLAGTKHVLSSLTREQRRNLKQTLSVLKEAGMKDLQRKPKALPWP